MQMNLTQKLELAFWDIIIFNLSRYTFIRRVLHSGYKFFDHTSMRSLAKVAVVVAAIGFISGFGTTIIFTMIF